MSYYVKDKGWFESSGAYMGSKRTMALAVARRCGFENDTKTFTRLLIEARVRRELLNAAWAAGAALREEKAR